MKLKKILKWFYPGMLVKRWVFLLLIGILFLGTGLGGLRGLENPPQIVKDFERIFLSEALKTRPVVMLIFLLGVICIALGLQRLLKSIYSLFAPQEKRDLVDVVYEKRQLRRGPRIVGIGGGYGLSSLLKGIKEYTSNLSAIVTMADSGGSSGRLREDFAMPPPGDIRNCLVALADTEPLMEDLFQHRFKGPSELKGHSFGNLFITAMSEVTKNFASAVRASSKILAIRGQVLPSTLSDVSLQAKMKDGRIVKGEAAIPEAEGEIEEIFLAPSDAPSNPETLKAIKEAEIIIIGPGSLYTSVMPNLLTKGMIETIENSKAIKIYVCNVMTQAGETDNYSASDHIEAIYKHTKSKFLDYVLVNTSHAPLELAKKYEEEKAFPVKVDEEKLKKLGVKVVKANFMSTRDYLRHEPDKLARAIMRIFMEVKGRGE
ncbi:YvcK family protein [bacterium]|nr:YvcK family protein [bacterium]